ncbi:oxidoreductase [Prauserella marina]|uniref:Predicted oxidoreductase n=1 Tax=Prauserella marina TaxID=530584 RepID=A0A222VTE4_9PSEU|nr:aldo/keto reductase [Prauserella marina]ASR37196.1 oxidoreductase [Prauserella marina]PWV72510.1 aryl-alcohol dehydrogenase-like predicted oxidoreductase [Prauserella marina]SDD78332.1 Predicted oxidoreductase [Prauserella marina]
MLDQTDLGDHATDTVTIGGDLPVHRIGFGAMRLSGIDHASALAVARRAIDLGVTFIDTADSYDLGRNEELLAEALHPWPRDVVVATKGGHVNLGTEWIPLGRPEYLRQQAELSLRRLRREQIDLYQLHRIDPLVPLSDQIGALRQLQDEGKVKHVGLSEVSVDQLAEAGKIVRIASVQNRYSLADRRSDDVLDHCERHGIVFIPWLPVARLARGTATDRAEVCAEVAARHGVSVARVALAWLLNRSRAMLPIPGTSSQAHLEDNLAAARLRLDADELARLTAEGTR